MIQVEKFLSLSIPVITFQGNKAHFVKQVLQITDSNFDKESIAWCSDKNKEILSSINHGTIILSENSFDYIKEVNKEWSKINWIVVEHPRSFFSLVLNTFFITVPKTGIIEKSANIHPSVNINSSCYIGNNVVIEEGVILGINIRINHNTSILSNTVIHDNVSIGCNCTIGGVGFGYQLNPDGSYEFIPHIGNVELMDNTEIGNNVCIDRAVLGSTVLHKNVKVDNLVHIAHGVQIGENSLIIANAMIAGSVTIGKNVWVAPSSSIIQKIEVGDNSLIGIGSTVLKHVEESTIVAGSPAKKIKSK